MTGNRWGRAHRGPRSLTRAHGCLQEEREAGPEEAAAAATRGRKAAPAHACPARAATSPRRSASRRRASRASSASRPTRSSRWMSRSGSSSSTPAPRRSSATAPPRCSASRWRCSCPRACASCTRDTSTTSRTARCRRGTWGRGRRSRDGARSGEIFPAEASISQVDLGGREALHRGAARRDGARAAARRRERGARGGRGGRGAGALPRRGRRGARPVARLRDHARRRSPSLVVPFLADCSIIDVARRERHGAARRAGARRSGDARRRGPAAHAIRARRTRPFITRRAITTGEIERVDHVTRAGDPVALAGRGALRRSPSALAPASFIVRPAARARARHRRDGLPALRDAAPVHRQRARARRRARAPRGAGGGERAPLRRGALGDPRARRRARRRVARPAQPAERDLDVHHDAPREAGDGGRRCGARCST